MATGPAFCSRTGPSSPGQRPSSAQSCLRSGRRASSALLRASAWLSSLCIAATPAGPWFSGTGGFSHCSAAAFHTFGAPLARSTSRIASFARHALHKEEEEEISAAMRIYVHDERAMGRPPPLLALTLTVNAQRNIPGPPR